MSSKGTTFAGADLEHYEECMRTVPAILLARAENREIDAAALFVVLQRNADEKGISVATAWGIFASASMTWCRAAFAQAAEAEGRPVPEVLRTAIAYITQWVDT